MTVDVDENVLHTFLFTLGDGFEIKTDSLAVPRPQKAQEQCRKQRINIRVVAILFRMGFFFNGCEKIVQVEPRKIRLRKEQGRMRHGGNLMERKAQVRKIASGKMNPVQIEFYAEKAKRFVMIRGKRMDCLRRKKDERAGLHRIDNIVAAHKERAFLQIKYFSKIVPV